MKNNSNFNPKNFTFPVSIIEIYRKAFRMTHSQCLKASKLEMEHQDKWFIGWNDEKWCLIGEQDRNNYVVQRHGYTGYFVVDRLECQGFILATETQTA